MLGNWGEGRTSSPQYSDKYGREYERKCLIPNLELEPNDPFFPIPFEGERSIYYKIYIHREIEREREVHAGWCDWD